MEGDSKNRGEVRTSGSGTRGRGRKKVARKDLVPAPSTTTTTESSLQEESTSGPSHHSGYNYSSNSGLNDGPVVQWLGERECSPPKDFKGKLDFYEHWVRCPYDPSHKVINKKLWGHYERCRLTYERNKLAKGEKMDIGVCRFDNHHHYRLEDLEEHEMICNKQLTVQTFATLYTRDKRIQEKMEEMRRDALPGTYSDDEDY